MSASAVAMFDVEEIDAVEEMRLRTWARANYVPVEERDVTWHPVVLEEMDAKDREMERGNPGGLE